MEKSWHTFFLGALRKGNRTGLWGEKIKGQAERIPWDTG